MHVNLVCLNCGEIVDVESEAIEAEVNRIAKSRGITVTGHRFDLYGICRKCEINSQG